MAYNPFSIISRIALIIFHALGGAAIIVLFNGNLTACSLGSYCDVSKAYIGVSMGGIGFAILFILLRFCKSKVHTVIYKGLPLLVNIIFLIGTGIVAGYCGKFAYDFGQVLFNSATSFNFNSYTTAGSTAQTFGCFTAAGAMGALAVTVYLWTGIRCIFLLCSERE